MHRRMPFVLHSVLVIALAGCEAPAPIAAPNLSVNGGGSAGPSATGRVEFTRSNPAGLVATHYSLSAVAQENGGVAGEVEFRAAGLTLSGPLDVRFHATVLCVTVAPDGKTARVGARIDGTSQDVAFTVEDNGEGANDTPDRASGAGPRPDDPVRGALDHCAGRTRPQPLFPDRAR